MMKRDLFIVVLLAILSLPAISGNAVAQQPQQPQPQDRRPAEQQKQNQPQTKQTTGTLSRSDKDFVTKAGQDGMAEVSLGELATRQASNDEVKKFGQRMADDHSKANNELKEWASKKGLTVPGETDAKHKALQDRLAKLSGADFDREFMSAMIKDHDSAVALFEKQARTGGDPELKAWAEKTLPTLREHQKIARELATKVGAKASD